MQGRVKMTLPPGAMATVIEGFIVEIGRFPGRGGGGAQWPPRLHGRRLASSHWPGVRVRSHALSLRTTVEPLHTRFTKMIAVPLFLKRQCNRTLRTWGAVQRAEAAARVARAGAGAIGARRYRRVLLPLHGMNPIANN
jgi:hypothetical protein